MNLIETKKNLRTYLRFFNKNMEQRSILTKKKTIKMVSAFITTILSLGTVFQIRQYLDVNGDR